MPPSAIATAFAIDHVKDSLRENPAFLASLYICIAFDVPPNANAPNPSAVAAVANPAAPNIIATDAKAVVPNDAIIRLSFNKAANVAGLPSDNCCLRHLCI